jgi:hypothetical protein
MKQQVDTFSDPAIRPARQPLVLVLVTALAAHGVLFWAPGLVAQSVAALVLAGLAPGILIVDLLIGDGEAPPTPAEALLYGLGVGYGVIVVVMLALSYLPGGIDRWLALAVFDGLLIACTGLLWRRHRRSRQPATRVASLPPAPVGRLFGLQPIVLAGGLVLLLLGGYLRFAGLGYAEFHGDEARGALRAAALLQGYEDVLFLHKKGPTEIVLPALTFALIGHLDETTARLPLAVANLAALGAVWLLGWRLLNPLAGWLAAFLLSFDGYLIAFARFLQYQSVVVLTSVLVMAILVRVWREPKGVMRYLVLAALLWATGLLSHYDALSIAPPVLFVLGAMLWGRRLSPGELVRAALPAVAVGGGLLALFYLPYLLHPRFESTLTYLVDQRFVAGGRFPHNGLHDILRRSLVYNSVYYVGFLAVATGLALVWAWRQGFDRLWGAVFGGLLVFLMGVTLWQTTWLRFEGVDLALLPFALALVPLWLAPKLRAQERLLWLWFGLLLLVTLFGMALARTHIYVFFAPWALLVGALMAGAWFALRRWTGGAPAYALGGLVLISLALSFGLYDYWYYAHTRVEVLRTWPDHAPPGYWTPPYTAEVDSLYGFPVQNGWKVVGALYADGALDGDYETNQRYAWVPHWYTLGQHRCASTATWYFAIDNLEPWTLPDDQAEDMLEEQGYIRWGEVTVKGAPRLVIYRQGDDDPNSGVRTFPLEVHRARFDAAMTPDIPLVSPIVEETIPNPVHINFGNDIWLEGYAIEGNERLEPGDTFRLTLYWRAQRNGLPPYKVFNQAFYGDGVMVAQKDAIPACDREPTTLWYPGDLVVDIHDIPVAADAPPGVYPLHTGLYTESDFARAPVLDDAGNPVSDHVHLADLWIVGRGE